MATLVVYSGSGNGYVRNSSTTSWNDCQNASTGDLSGYDGEWGWAISEESSGSTEWIIFRTFLPFDTSALPDVEITGAELDLYCNLTSLGDSDLQAYVGIYEGTQSSTSSLANSDFDAVGTTKLSDDTWDFGTTETKTFTLNSTGIGKINKSGFTKLAAREGHDAEGVAIANDSSNNAAFTLSGYAGTTYDPKLSVTFQDLSFSIDPSSRRARGVKIVGPFPS